MLVQVVDYGASERVDLSERSNFLLDLLDGTHRWRERLVEELTFESDTHVRVQSTYQIEFPPDLLRDYVCDLERTREVHVLVPLTTRPKRALLNFDLVGAGGRPAHLVSRSSTASLQRDYLKWMAAKTSAPFAADNVQIDALFKAICEFSPDVWRSYLTKEPSRPLALQAYLKDGLAARMATAPTGGQIRAWSDASLAIGQMIWRAAGQNERDELSAAHDVLLALPLMDELPSDPSGIDALLASLHAALVRLVPGREENDHLLFAQLAEYGVRYELLVETTVPILEPATIKLSEDRPLRPERRIHAPWLGVTRQPFAINDARSMHLEARCGDPYVRFRQRFKVRDHEKRELGLGPLESARITHESLSVYTSHSKRPPSADVRLRLLLPAHVYAVAAMLSFLNIAAAVMATGVSGGGPTLDRLAILAVPTTIAAAFALTREQTALASRLIAGPRWVLILTTLVLWTVVIFEVGTYHPPKDPPVHRARA
jgi:hypothetical protein